MFKSTKSRDSINERVAGKIFSWAPTYHTQEPIAIPLTPPATKQRNREGADRMTCLSYVYGETASAAKVDGVFSFSTASFSAGTCFIIRIVASSASIPNGSFSLPPRRAPSSLFWDVVRRTSIPRRSTYLGRQNVPCGLKPIWVLSPDCRVFCAFVVGRIICLWLLEDVINLT